MKILKWMNKNFEEALLIVLLSVMAVIMGIQVIARYLFNASMAWTEEITRFLFIWSGFISISYCIHKTIAIRIEQIVEIFGKKVKAIVLTINYLIEVVFFVYLIPYAYSYLRTTMITEQVSTAMEIPMALVVSAPLVGFALSVLRGLQQIYRELRDLTGRKGTEVE